MNIVGHPDINWDTSTSDSAEDSPSQNFLSTYKDCFLYQHVAHPTHYRGLQQANILDLIMTNESDMIDKLHYTDPIGKSHHVVLDWIFTGYGRRHKAKVKKYLFNKGDYDGLRMCLDEVDWSSCLSNKSVDDIWEFISNQIHTATETYIPSKTVTSSQSHNQRPIWMNGRAFSKIKKKKAAFCRFKETKQYSDYLEYVSARNAAKSEIRKAVRDYEKEIAKCAKTNPKAFYRYANSKVKSQTRFPDMKCDDGTEVTGNKDKLELFNKFFGSMYTVEDMAQSYSSFTSQGMLPDT